MLTAWDFDALILVGLCRYMTALQVARGTGRTLDRARRRLRRLFDAGYFDFALVSSNAPTLVSLSTAGVAAVRERHPELAARLGRPAAAIAQAGVNHHLGVVDARLYTVAWGESRGTRLVRWANAGGDVARELGLPAFHVEPDGVAQFDARLGGPRFVAVEVDCAATEPAGSVVADKLDRYTAVFAAHGLDRLWVVVKDAAPERLRTVAALVARAGLAERVRVVDHALIVARPVVDIEAAGGADRAEGPKTVSAPLSFRQGIRRA